MVGAIFALRFYIKFDVPKTKIIETPGLKLKPFTKQIYNGNNIHNIIIVSFFDCLKDFPLCYEKIILKACTSSMSK